MNVVESVGIELEGGMRESDMYDVIKIVNDSRIDWSFDASVYVPAPLRGDRDWLNDVEIKFWVYIDELEKLKTLMRLLWLKGFRQNYTCGNHVHIKFTNEACYVIMLLKVSEFVDEYVKYARRKKNREKYLSRLESRYCEVYRNSKDLLDNYWGEGSRYRIVNFVSFYEEQGTLEFRIFPFARSWRECYSNVVFLVKTLNKLLKDPMEEEEERINVSIFEVIEEI